MFNSAYEDADHKPLLLWLNGGPGCSSLDGWANEHGPMQFKDDGKFYLNEFSWNRAANVIYLESPGDVGFSFLAVPRPPAASRSRGDRCNAAGGKLPHRAYISGQWGSK